MAPIFGNSDGLKLAAMRPVGPGQSGPAQKGDPGRAGVTHKEFSCRKNWLFPRPPTNGGTRFIEKVKYSKFPPIAKKNSPPASATLKNNFPPLPPDPLPPSRTSAPPTPPSYASPPIC